MATDRSRYSTSTLLKTWRMHVVPESGTRIRVTPLFYVYVRSPISILYYVSVDFFSFSFPSGRVICTCIHRSSLSVYIKHVDVFCNAWSMLGWERSILRRGRGGVYRVTLVMVIMVTKNIVSYFYTMLISIIPTPVYLILVFTVDVRVTWKYFLSYYA